MQLEHTKQRSRPSLWITAAAMVGLLAACSDDGTSPPATGALQVTVTTTGADLDPDGYNVLVDGGSAQTVGVNGTVTFASVTAGSHEVTLQGLAANCSVGAATQTVSVSAGEAAIVTFLVTCTQVLVDLEIVTLTTGQAIDADGYTFAIDAGAAQAIGVNDSLTVGASPGNRSVTLGGVASNCTVVGTNPRPVTVPASGSARVDFIVNCSSTQGSLVVTTSTTGVDPDPDGYTVTVDGGVNQTIGVSSTVTINNVSAGDRTVALTGVADNCTVTAPHPRTVTVPVGSSMQTDFIINCTNILGTVDVVTATAGVDLDGNGYTVTVQGRPPVFIDVNDTVSVTDVVWGDRTVTLSNVDGNCTVDPPGASRTVAVPQRDTVETVFNITCVALTGSLTVIANTTGTDLDADGYMVSVDGGPAQALPANGQVVFNNATTGDRSVLLTGIAPNCSVTPNPATVTVPPQGNANYTFNVTCSTLVGSVQVTTMTTGSSLDPDGYSVTVGVQAPVAIIVNGVQTVMNVPVGMRSVTLSGVASNCTVAGENPRMVNVTDGGTAMTTFEVACFTPISNKIVFDTDRDGEKDIYVMNPDGSAQTPLTDDPGRDSAPYVSHDGAKIVFVSNRDGNNEIYVMNADGNAQTRLTNNGASDSEPAFSPDGTKIVFTSERDGGDPEVYVMAADGSNPTRLTTQAGRDGLAQFSPDGSDIAFTSERDGDLEIWVMDADGGNPTQLTFNTVADFAPAYSPLGPIAFTSERDGDREIYTMDANGNNQVNRTNDPAGDLAPQWSPDGSQIAFASTRDGNNDVFTMTSTGASQTNRTNNAADDFEVSWR